MLYTQTPYYGITEFMIVSKKNSDDEILTLLENIDVDSHFYKVSMPGMITLLIESIINHNSIYVIQKILDKSKDKIELINYVDMLNGTALIYAIFSKRVHLVKLLLKNGADPNFGFIKTLIVIPELLVKPLYYVYFSKDSEMTHLLLEYGADIYYSMRNGLSVIEYSIVRKDIEAFKKFYNMVLKDDKDLEYHQSLLFLSLRHSMFDISYIICQNNPQILRRRFYDLYFIDFFNKTDYNVIEFLLLQYDIKILPKIWIPKLDIGNKFELDRRFHKNRSFWVHFSRKMDPKVYTYFMEKYSSVFGHLLPDNILLKIAEYENLIYFHVLSQH